MRWRRGRVRIRIIRPPMYSLLRLFTLFSLAEYILSEKILLPLSIPANQSFTSLYLCHLHQLNNAEEVFLRNYEIINNGNASHAHHLLLYECSAKEKLSYSGLCGIYSARLMPELVYRHCQTRIIIAWAKGGQVKYTYPVNTGLKLNAYTQLLLEVHFEPSIPPSHSTGIQLGFFPTHRKPRYEIGVLTLGTLANSPLYLPPLLDSIGFPTYCFNDCLRSFLGKNAQMNVFSILVHAHRHAIRITLEDNHFNRLIDRNPFEYHRQENTYYPPPYPQISSAHELALTCYYSTQNDSLNATYGGHSSDNEMCQAFLYYYPKVPSFPLCLSLPIYKNHYAINNWTTGQSLLIRQDLEANRNHLSMCGDNTILNGTNQTVLQMKVHQRPLGHFEQYTSISFHSAVSFCSLLLFLSILCCCLVTKKHLHSFANGGTL